MLQACVPTAQNAAWFPNTPVEGITPTQPASVALLEVQLLQFWVEVVTPGALPLPLQTMPDSMKAPTAFTLIGVRSLSPPGAARSMAVATNCAPSNRNQGGPDRLKREVSVAATLVASNAL